MQPLISINGRKYCPPDDEDKCALKRNKCGKPNPWIEFRVLFKGKRDAQGRSLNTPAAYRVYKNKLTPTAVCRLFAARSGTNTVPEILEKREHKRTRSLKNILNFRRITPDFRSLEERKQHKVEMNRMLAGGNCGITVLREGYIVFGGVLAFKSSAKTGDVSMYGDVFAMTKAKGFQIRKAVVKIQRRKKWHKTMQAFISDMDDEKKVISKCNGLLDRRVTQNIVYHFSVLPGLGQVCPPAPPFSDTLYQIHVMEALDGICHGFFFKSPTPRTHIERISCALQFLHGMMVMERHGMYHNDAKTDNIMYKTVPAGGVWEYTYKKDGKDMKFYVPNTGQVWVLIDFSIVSGRDGVLGYQADNVKKFFMKISTDPSMMKRANRHTWLIVTTLQDVLGSKHPLCVKLRDTARKNPTALLGNLSLVIHDLVTMEKLANLEEGEVILDSFGP